MKLIVGLGNPGTKYASHRHNVGFMAVDRIVADHRVGNWRQKFQGICTSGAISSHRVTILKPQTYMNESGRSVGEAMRYFKLSVYDVVVLHDELDLAPGRLRVKSGGGNAGHNGLRSIQAHIGAGFWRIRIGIGHPGQKSLVHSYVLHDFSSTDSDWLDALLPSISRSAEYIAKGDMRKFTDSIAKVRTQTQSTKLKVETSRQPPALNATQANGPEKTATESLLSRLIKKFRK